MNGDDNKAMKNYNNNNMANNLEKNYLRPSQVIVRHEDGVKGR
jgi:hypothetical protein